LKNIWQIALGRPEEPDVLYCGVEPAALFETRDAGETWSRLAVRLPDVIELAAAPA